MFVGRLRGVGRDEDGVAIGLGCFRSLGADEGIRSGLVVDHDRLPALQRHGLADGAGQLVGGTTSSKGNDEGDGFFWKALSPSLRRGDEGGGRQGQCQRTDASGIFIHGLSPVVSFKSWGTRQQ
jgi:hypothetical protein